MLFWHVAGVLLLFRYVFRDPKVDVRFLTVGALLPNLVDKPLGTLLRPDFFGADRIYGHTLLFSTSIMVVALVATRRGRVRRRWMAVAIGAMLHLVLDGMWTSGATLFWPVLGWAFDPGVTPYWDGFVQRELVSAQTLLQEIVGLGYLGYVWGISGLSDPVTRASFFRNGRLADAPPRVQT